ncbi:hypothetical protein DHW03_10140 [Pedobacter yonginense]|uniref:DUF4369 domain-containing protein n=1 Tax=Pedobacter yonginense TaxID=651869 RepID=A0A317EM15_9SPHI|nr:hypothetical protein [Pedobacter yonginense]PWS27920.1 hypothetical protein DHW03_10140 [Pedobacter yonginense]
MKKIFAKLLGACMFSLILFTNIQTRAQNTDQLENVGIINKATVYLTSGEFKTGVVAFHLYNTGVLLFSDTSTFNSFDKLYTRKKSEFQVIKIEDITSVVTSMRGTWFVKNAQGAKYYLKEGLTFFRLVSDETGKLKLYERKVSNPDKGNRLDSFYYVTDIDNERNVISVDAAKFMPNFPKKASVFFAACPDLAQKITDKTPGYVPFEEPKFSLSALKQKISDNIKNGGIEQPREEENPFKIWERLLKEYNFCIKN